MTMAVSEILYRGGEVDSLNVVGGVATITGGTRYDAEFSACGISLNGNSLGMNFKSNVDGEDVLWSAFYAYNGGGGTGDWVTVIDSAERPAIRVRSPGNVKYRLEHNTSATATPIWTLLGEYEGGDRNYIVFRISMGPDKRFGFYINGDLRGEGGFTNSGLAALSRFTVGPNNSGLLAISQIQFSRNISLVNTRVWTRKAVADGALSQMTGAVTALNKTTLNDTTALTSVSVGQTSTYSYQTVTVPEGMAMADDVWIWTRGQHDGSEPSSAKIVDIFDSVTTKSSNLPFDVGFKQVPTVLTGMSPAKWNGGERGFESTTP